MDSNGKPGIGGGVGGLAPVAVYVLVEVTLVVSKCVEVMLWIAVVAIVRLVVTPVTVVNTVDVDGTIVVPLVLVVR